MFGQAACFKSRFRILKGGKISLVVSALVISAMPSYAGPAYLDLTISDNRTVQEGHSFSADGNSLTITETGSVTVDNSDYAIDINAEGYSFDFDNSGEVIASSEVANQDRAGLYLWRVRTAGKIFNIYNRSGGSIDADTTRSARGIDVKVCDSAAELNIYNEAGASIDVSSSSGTAYGVEVRNDGVSAGLNGVIQNAGTITVDAALDAWGINVEDMYNESLVDNLGIIHVASAVGGSFGMGPPMDATSMHSDSQIINNTSGEISTQGNQAFGIYMTDMLDNTKIINKGEISAVSTSGIGSSVSYGIYIDHMSDSALIQNTGVIESTSAEKAYGIGKDWAPLPRSMYNNSQIINDTGGIITVDGATQSTGLSMDAMFDNSKIINRGTVNAYINGELDKDAYAVAVGSVTGSSMIENYGILRGSLSIGKSSTGKMTNFSSGTISLPYNANGVDAAYVRTFTNSGTLEIGLQTDGTLEGTTYSQLSTYDATFEEGSIIKVNVLDASTNEGLLVGETLEDVVSATNALTIERALTITDNSALLNFEYVEDGETIDLNVVEGATILDSTIAGGGQTPAKAAATALQTIQDRGASPAMTPIFTALNALSTNQAVAQAVESTTPQTSSASNGASQQIANGVQGIVEMRQNVNLGGGGGLNSGDPLFAQKNMWMKPYGTFGEQRDKDGINGFDIDAYGLGIGVDGEYKEGQSIGMAFFYTQADVEVNNVAQKAELDVYTALVYGNLPVLDERTNLLYQAGYSWQKTNTQRRVFTGSVANADYTSTTASLDLKLMRDYQLNNALLLQPMVEATYRYFTNPSYQESGAGVLSLATDKFTSEEMIVGLGVMGHYQLDETSKLVANVNVGYDIKNDNQTTTSAYQGAAGVKFDTDGIDNGRWQYEAGIGVEKDISNQTNVNLSYSYQGEGSKFSNNTLSARVVYRF